MARRDPRIAYIVEAARRKGLDPEAVLAIDGHEGLSGRIGDGGHAFGPSQMNDVGGVLTGKTNGRTPQQMNEWAWSHEGIDYALDGMARVAKGLKGKAAITTIASQYERPKDVPGEINDAWAHYGKYGAGGPVAVQGASGRVTAQQVAPDINAGGGASRQQLAQLVFGGGNAVDFGSNQVHAPNLMALVQARAAQTAAPDVPVTPRPSMPRTSSRTPAGTLPGGVTFTGNTQGVDSGFLAKLSHAAKAAGVTQIRVNSGYRSPAHNAAVGGVGHSNHMSGHALDGDAFIPGRGWVPLGQVLLPIAGKFGLRSGDVPGFYNGNPDPVHVDDGWNQSH